MARNQPRSGILDSYVDVLAVGEVCLLHDWQNLSSRVGKPGARAVAIGADESTLPAPTGQAGATGPFVRGLLGELKEVAREYLDFISQE